MLTSFYIVNTLSEVLLEKHFRAVLPRTVLDGFFEAQLKASAPENVPPCVQSGRNYAFSVFKHKVFFVALVQHDVPPLFVLELLQRIVSATEFYLGGTVTEKQITGNIVVLSQMLEEMVDGGFPLVTELNVLQDLIRPPSLLATLTGDSAVKKVLPPGQLTHTHWRRQGVKYTSNEFFLDITEEVNCIMDRNGTVAMASITGTMNCKCRLSGMPDLTLSFINSRLLDDVSLHPCVRLARWEQEKVISFVPPDGKFVLGSYVMGTENQLQLPLLVKPSVTYQEGHAKFEVEVTARQTGGKVVEDFTLSAGLPKTVTSASLTPSAGSYTFDQLTKTIKWEVKKVNPATPITLRGTLMMTPGAPVPDVTTLLQLTFNIPTFTASGLKVNKLDLVGDVKYKPFKGVKYNSVAGRYQVRC